MVINWILGGRGLENEDWRMRPQCLVWIPKVTTVVEGVGVHRRTMRC